MSNDNTEWNDPSGVDSTEDESDMPLLGAIGVLILLSAGVASALAVPLSIFGSPSTEAWVLLVVMWGVGISLTVRN